MTRLEIAAKLLIATTACFWEVRAKHWRDHHRYRAMAQEAWDEVQRCRLDPDPDRGEAYIEVCQQQARELDGIAEHYREVAVDMIRPIVEAEIALHDVDPELINYFPLSDADPQKLDPERTARDIRKVVAKLKADAKAEEPAQELLERGLKEQKSIAEARPEGAALGPSSGEIPERLPGMKALEFVRKQMGVECSDVRMLKRWLERDDVAIHRGEGRVRWMVDKLELMAWARRQQAGWAK